MPSGDSASKNRLQVRSQGMAPWNTEIHLNGQRLEKVVGLDFQFRTDALHTATIAIRIDEVDIDAETLMKLQAVVEAQETGVV